MSLNIKYNDFLLYQLLESILTTSKEFKSIINDMPQSDNIADIIYNIIDRKTDIKTNYNLIDVYDDKNDEISFLPDTQYQRFISKGDDVKSKSKSSAKIGRMIGQILRDNGHTQFKDSDIERFVNSFKAVWNKKHGITNRKTEVVKGKDILKWYSISNYNSNNGTLGNSCMRYEKVNHFMNIYAENPDKISMVVITEDNKLLARALFWVLDETTQGSGIKFYLDRIYTEQDSDFQFLYDWVVENLCNKDENILSSHKDEDNDRFVMKVFLKNTTFEHYPYADTFNYLYEKLDSNGKLLGGGFVSNVNMMDAYGGSQKQTVEKYVISEIRNHNEGYPNRISHVFSKVENKFILKKEAFFDGNLGWVPTSECKKCKFTGEWIYKQKAVWSESMKDWIDMDYVVNDPNYGIVHSDALYRIATKYIGGENKHPLDVMSEMENGQKLFELETRLKADVNSDEYIRPEYRFRGPTYYTKDLVVKDFWGEWQIKEASVELVYCGPYDNSIKNDVNLQKFKELVIERRGGAYLLREDAILFGLDIKEGKSIWMSVYDFKSNYENLNYSYFINFVNSSDVDSSVKERILFIKNRFHDYWMERSSSYRERFEIQQKMKGVDVQKLYLEVFDSVWKKFMVNESEIEEELRAKFSRYGVEISEEQLQYAWEVLSAIVLFYCHYEDSSESKGMVREKLRGNEEFQLKITIDRFSWSDFLEICRLVLREFLEDLDNYIKDSINEESEKYNIDKRSLSKFLNVVNISLLDPFS